MDLLELENTYWKSKVDRTVYIYEKPNDRYRHICWLVGDNWVTDDGPCKYWSDKRKYRIVRKIDLNQWMEREKIAHINKEITLRSL